MLGGLDAIIETLVRPLLTTDRRRDTRSEAGLARAPRPPQAQAKAHQIGVEIGPGERGYS